MSCGSSEKVYRDDPRWFDPLGPRRDGTHGPTGAPELRDTLFRNASQALPGMEAAGQAASRQAMHAAQNPGWDALERLATRTADGEFLSGSPQLRAMTDSIYRRSAADAANAEAGIRDQFARTGLRFGTGYQQASQANRAAANARAAETAAGLQLADYQQERQNQALAGTMLEQASSAPLQYLNQASASSVAPYMAIGQLLAQLAGGGQVATPNSAVVQQPGVLDYLIAGTQAAGSLT